MLSIFTFVAGKKFVYSDPKEMTEDLKREWEFLREQRLCFKCLEFGFCEQNPPQAKAPQEKSGYDSVKGPQVSNCQNSVAISC